MLEPAWGAQAVPGVGLLLGVPQLVELGHGGRRVMLGWAGVTEVRDWGGGGQMNGTGSR